MRNDVLTNVPSRVKLASQLRKILLFLYRNVHVCWVFIIGVWKPTFKVWQSKLNKKLAAFQIWSGKISRLPTQQTLNLF